MQQADKQKLLLSYYAPTVYQGVTMSDKGRLWRNSYGSQQQRTQAKLDGIKVKSKLPFNMSYAMDKHLNTDNANLAIVFPSDQNYILAFDLDGDTDIYEIIMSSDCLIHTLEDMGFKPLMYLSGGKGIHIEVRFATKVHNVKLKRLKDIIVPLVSCEYIDRTYPSKAAYRMFGCKHYRTKKFTSIIKDNRELNEVDSWIAFEDYYSVGCLENTEAKIDKVIKESTIIKPVKKAATKEKKPPARGLIKDTAKYSVDSIERCHANGLYSNDTRYLMSYQLGRYFNEILNFTEDQAKVECELWLKRHYPDQTLDYFGDDVASRIKTPFHRCIDETIANCINGYHQGQSFKPRVMLKFSRKKTEKYVDGLKLSKPQKAALRYMIRQADKLNSLIFYHSYAQLSKGFGCNPSTVPIWIAKFVELGAISIIMKGKYVINGNNIATFYELTIPNDTYEVITANMDTVTEPAMEVAQISMVGT